jgi:hypothetical protein
VNMKNFSSVTIAALLIALSPFANAQEISDGDFASIRRSLAEMGVDQLQLSNEDLVYLMSNSLDIKDLETNVQNLKLNLESRMTCSSVKCHTMAK